jgi:leader peptidase (prepilin peptidase)/N-methyltransferase
MSSSLADVTEASANADEPDVGDPAVAEDEVVETVAAAPGIPRHPVVLVPLVGLPVLAFAAFGFGAQALVTALAAAVLVTLAAIDIEHRVLPNRILLPATGILLAAQLAFFPDRALEWLLAGVAAAIFLALPLIIRRDAMGMGDIKLAVLLGVVTGWGVFGAIVIGCLAMLPAALWLLRRDGSIRGATLPFGPFLALGTLVVLFTA